MKIRRFVSSFVGLMAAMAVSSCFPDPGYGGGMPRPPGQRPPGGGAETERAYSSGLQDGTRDRERNAAYQPQRGEREFPPGLRGEYRRGYDAGFRSAQGDDWTARRAFDQGRRAGVRDRLDGRSSNPNRHIAGVPPRFHSDFREGYATGWNSSPVARPPALRPRPGLIY